MAKNILKQEDGCYYVNGVKFKKLIGTRAEVWHGTAYKTAGKLTKGQLVKSKIGRIVSKSKHNSSIKEKRLQKYGYTAKKGHFGPVKMDDAKGVKSAPKRSKSVKVNGTRKKRTKRCKY
jgi:hypothetical protein